jgi:hypothetical protein
LIFFEKNQSIASFFFTQGSLWEALVLVGGMVLLQLCLAALALKPFSWLEQLSYGIGDWLIKRVPSS